MFVKRANSITGSFKTLIVNADDFGLTHSINQGIIKCFNDGIVTSASILPNGRAFEEAVNLAKECNLNVGIHLTLMDGEPLSRSELVRSLIAKNNYFPGNYVDFSLRYFSKRILLNDIETEFRAQIEKFMDAGLEPRHVNGHNHVHIFPGIIDIVINLMKEYGIKFIRVPCTPVFSSFKRLSLNSIAKFFLVSFARAAMRKISNRNLYTTDFFEGLFISGALTKKNLHEVLEGINAGLTELMCHPGYVDNELLALYSWNYNWENELNALCDDEIKKKIESLGIKLAGF